MHATLDVSEARRPRVLLLHGTHDSSRSLPGFEVVQSSSQLASSVDCILVGPTSAEVALTVLERLQDVPVVALLSAGGEEECDVLVQGGAFECFPPGTDHRRVVRALNRAAQSQRASTETETTQPSERGSHLYRALHAANAFTYEVDLDHPERTTIFGLLPFIQEQPEAGEEPRTWWIRHIHPDDLPAYRRDRARQVESGYEHAYRMR